MSVDFAASRDPVIRPAREDIAHSDGSTKWQATLPCAKNQKERLTPLLEA
jgi:hypothetical protein